jgi:transcription-repair coupling factor (superfamily II helicase)
MIDRFGLSPEPLKNLFNISALKIKGDSLGIIKIEANERGGKLEFNETPNIKPETIIRLIQTQSQRFRLDGPTRLRFTLDKHEPAERIGLIEKLLISLS